LDTVQGVVGKVLSAGGVFAVGNLNHVSVVRPRGAVAQIEIVGQIKNLNDAADTIATA
jgi:hypothetical protein